MGGAEAGRDIDLRSRPGLLKLGVVTWPIEIGCRDLAWAMAGSVWCRDLEF